MNLMQLVRPNIQKLMPYSSARDEYSGIEGVFLDANENPFGSLNRYPDPHQTLLRQAVSKGKNFPVENIMIGNGSDEIIDLTFRIFCEPGKDKILICPPTYGMYRVAADINNIEAVEVPLDGQFQLQTEEILERVKQENVKIIFLCSPNNPTGNSLNDLEVIVENFEGIVFVDEAYIDFSTRESYLKYIKKFPNLIISQTFSKARGLANARVGLVFANAEIIDCFNRVKPPYNVSGLNQKAALDAILDTEKFQTQLKNILVEREYLLKELQSIHRIKEVFSTDANFILVSCEHADLLYRQLLERKIIVRNRSAQIPNMIRISVGTTEENKSLIKALKSL